MFGTTIGVSAFLLFTSQPMVGRLVLPVFGGAPAVWATVLVFFQTLLLLGYLYAHLLVTRLRPLPGAALHVVVMVIALAATWAAPRDVASLHDPSLPVVPGLLAILLVIIGPAAFAMTATTPLVSAWYARVRRAADPDADPRDPYWLYALSNGGSLVSLLAYPLLIEPRVGLADQRTLWGAGFAVLTILIAVSAWRLWAAGPAATSDAVPDAAPVLEPVPALAADAPPTARDRLRWIVLSAIPAGLLSAVTNLVTTDLISAPLLWVVPLAIYLGSFVVAFSARGRRVVPLFIALSPAALTLLWVPIGSAAGWPILPLLLIEYAGLGVVAIALHGRLAGLRPDARHLTGFYLVMSAGGALGGAFVALVAPVAFDGVWEYPILIAGALIALALTSEPQPARRPTVALLAGAHVRLLPYLAVVLPLLAFMAATDALGFEAASRWTLVGALVLLFGGVPRFLALTSTVVLVLATFILPPPVLFRDRSFFGVTEVTRDQVSTTLFHGTTVHGQEWLDPDRRDDPPSYYARTGPVGDIFSVWGERPPGVIRVLGLGAGTLAVYARPGDDLAFYEIDPLVADVAADPGFFTYLSGRVPPAEVRIGDGRLLLAAEPDDSLGLVIMDAFSSDAVPAHLITVEALADADRALARDGILAVHVSNRYYDLGPPVATALASLGLTVLELQYAPTPDEIAAGAGLAHFVVGTRDPAVLAGLAERGWIPARMSAAPLTDDFPDLLRYLGR
ncbi:MAG TPA: fused MFS/spermidine synthase [Candidatus Limnocylindrales bacterium]|nr:fused MFS/spermidine synthase [Candidatus Limnocylindrales bacterium]